MDYAKALGLYAKLIASESRVERKGDTVPYTALNGNMSSALHKDGTVALRLPAAEREAFLKKYKTALAAHYGVVQPEYVVVPDKLLARTVELSPWFAASVTYVAGLKPKATSKQPKATKKSASKRGTK